MDRKGRSRDPRRGMLQESPEGIRVAIHVSPGAKRNAIEGIDLWRGRVRTAVREKAIGGRANKAVICLFAEALAVRKEQIVLEGGTSRDKVLIVRDMDISTLPKRLRPYIDKR